MKLLYFLTLVAIGISGYLAYGKGQLASLHPLLDPMTHHGASSEVEVAHATSEENSESQPTQPEPKSDHSKKPAIPETKPDPKQVRAEQAEERRLKEEEKKRNREAQAAAYETAQNDYQQKKSVILGEIAELDRQNSGLTVEIREAEENRYQQERAWSAQKIKNAREQDKQRAASSQFIDSLVAKQEVILAQIQEKGRELTAIRP